MFLIRCSCVSNSNLYALQLCFGLSAAAMNQCNDSLTFVKETRILSISLTTDLHREVCSISYSDNYTNHIMSEPLLLAVNCLPSIAQQMFVEITLTKGQVIRLTLNRVFYTVLKKTFVHNRALIILRDE